MAVEVAGNFLHWSPPPPTRGHLSVKTVAHVISALLHTPSRNYHDRAMTHHTDHHIPFLGTTLHRFHQRRIARGGGIRDPSSASIDGFVDDGDNEEEFGSRINELNLKSKIKAESQRNREAETGDSTDESAIPPAFQKPPSILPDSDSISPLAISINPKIPEKSLESWHGGDAFALQKMEWRANSFDLPLSLRILKWKKKRLGSCEMPDSACSSVKKAFSSMVFIVREVQSHVIRMRKALLSADNFQIQGTLARVHGDLHASFVWLFHHIFSSTPTLMLYLMLLLANFTIFSITDHHAAAVPLPPLQSVSVAIEESRNPTLPFNSVTSRRFT